MDHPNVILHLHWAKSSGQGGCCFQHVWCWPRFLGMNLIVLSTPFIIVYKYTYIIYTYIYIQFIHVLWKVEVWKLASWHVAKMSFERTFFVKDLFLHFGWASWLGMVWGIDLSTQLPLGWSGTCSRLRKIIFEKFESHLIILVWLDCLV